MVNTVTNGDMGQLANKISQTFKSVSEDCAPLVIAQPQQYDIATEYIVSMDDVERKLMKVKIGKACGLDYIPNWVLRDFAECLAKPLCSIFNASFHEAYVPSLMKSADVISLLKVKPPRD